MDQALWINIVSTCWNRCFTERKSDSWEKLYDVLFPKTLIIFEDGFALSGFFICNRKIMVLSATHVYSLLSDLCDVMGGKRRYCQAKDKTPSIRFYCQCLNYFITLIAISIPTQLLLSLRFVEIQLPLCFFDFQWIFWVSFQLFFVCDPC